VVNMPTVKLKESTVQRIDKVFKEIFAGNSDIAQKLAETSATWDFKINAILDRLYLPSQSTNREM